MKNIILTFFLLTGAAFAQVTPSANVRANPNTGALIWPSGFPASVITFTQTGTGATATTLDARAKASVLNAKTDFGCAGNDSTDDTTALQAAINAATTAGASLDIPQGTYKITSGLLIPNGTLGFTMSGRGSNQTIIKQYTANQNGVYTTDTNGLDFITIRDLAIIYGGTGTSTGSALSLHAATGANDSWCLQNLALGSLAAHNGFAYGFNASDWANSLMSNVSFSQCTTEAGFITGNSNSDIMINVSATASFGGIWSGGFEFASAHDLIWSGGDLGGPSQSFGANISGSAGSATVTFKGHNCEMAPGAPAVLASGGGTSSATIENCSLNPFASTPIAITSATFAGGALTIHVAKTDGVFVTQSVTVAGMTTSANNGAFPVASFVANTSITLTNSSGVAQAGAAGTATWAYTAPGSYGVVQSGQCPVYMRSNALSMKQSSAGFQAFAYGLPQPVDIFTGSSVSDSFNLGPSGVDGIGPWVSGESHGGGTTFNGSMYYWDSHGHDRNFGFGGIFDWVAGDFALYASSGPGTIGMLGTAGTGQPNIPVWYIDVPNNRTTIGHAAATQPVGTSTLNLEGSINVGATNGISISRIRHGVATLSTGAVTVTDANVTTNSRIFLTAQSLGTVTVPTALAVTARSAGTSFTVTSANAIDTSVVAWEMVEP